jgi:hypothetical protein
MLLDPPNAKSKHRRPAHGRIASSCLARWAAECICGHIDYLSTPRGRRDLGERAASSALSCDFPTSMSNVKRDLQNNQRGIDHIISRISLGYGGNPGNESQSADHPAPHGFTPTPDLVEVAPLAAVSTASTVISIAKAHKKIAARSAAVPIKWGEYSTYPMTRRTMPSKND